jgi:peptidoglycan/xylan/chitin deacetylase (PgdA/CDA1 family)
VNPRDIRRHRAVAALAVIACAAFAWGLAAGNDGGGEGGRARPAVRAHPLPQPAPPRHRRSVIDRVLRRTDRVSSGHGRRVALTFDDGPSPYTPKIVRVLRSRRAAATFFPVGYAIQRYTRFVKLLRRDGFTVGDHTLSHREMGRLSGAIQLHEIDGQVRLLRHAGLPYPRLFRPPYGSFDHDTLGLLQERRMLMVLWSVNPQDYERPGAKRIAQRVVDAVRPGSIVLMHDGGGDRSQTVAALPRIIHRLRARGYRLVTVPGLFRRRGSGNR